jgi:branched-chain amino acid transport system substrate-binding protein
MKGIFSTGALILGLVCAAHADVIKVGVVLPLTGEYDFVGKAQLDGMQMALTEAQGNTRHQYRLFCEDGEFQPGKSSLAAQKLLNIDKVDCICSIWGAGAMAVAPLAEARRIPHMANDWDLVWVQKYKYTLDLAAPCDLYAEMQLKMVQRWGCHRVALLWQHSADWIYGFPYVQKALQSDPSITIVFNQSFNAPVRDFRTVLTRVKEARPDLIIVLSILPESEIILRQARELGIACRMTGYYEDLSEKKLGEGMSFICFTNPEKSWVKRYKAMYKHDPAYSTNFGYDQMESLIHAYEGFEHKPDGMALVQAARKMPVWMGASGLMRPRADGMLVQPLWIVKYRNAIMIDDPQFADLNKEMGW